MKKTNEVSKLVGVSRRTLQYYDDEGVLQVERSQNNHRLYDQEALERIWQIMIYKEMGFELKEIKQLMAASDIDRKKYFEQRVTVIKGQVAKLKVQMRFVLLVQRNGIPPVDVRNRTYASNIEEMRKKMEKEDAEEYKLYS